MLYDKLKTASRLRELRLEKGYTMQEVAKKMTSMVENGLVLVENSKRVKVLKNA